jgi:acyl-CoA reductase-like NAD-dependent aldehyde dehydrogenase
VIVEDHVAEAVAVGAVVRCGGSRTGQGYGFAPTVLDQCTNTMRVVREETFGPVIPIVRVADVDEAVALANDNDYGLGASVWTKDAARGATIARRLDVGMAWVNNHSITSTMTEAPWTGTKASGTGVAQSRHALPVFIRWRTLLVDTNRDPDAWWMPADASLDQLVDAVSRRSLGSLGATLSLLGVLGRRVRAIRAALK